MAGVAGTSISELTFRMLTNSETVALSVEDRISFAGGNGISPPWCHWGTMVEVTAVRAAV